MRLLAIETSCDETSIAVVSMTDGVFVIEKNITSSQAKIHAQYGGVVPEVAAREHAAWIIPLLQEVGIEHDGTGIDVVAVTAGPGLVPALRVGVELAKTLAWAWHKPLVAVNHLEGHIYSVWLSDFKAPLGASAFDRPEGRVNPQFPALCLLVSGGHTELILMRAHGQYELLGMTRDDAAGEAFDKVAKLLGLSYPGGPQISKAALEGHASAINFPRPMIDSKDFDFSFAGLKTAVRVYLDRLCHCEEGIDRRSTKQSRDCFACARNDKNDVAASFQQAVVDVLVAKTLRAAQSTQPKSVILSGGVSANRLLRETLSNAIHSRFSGVSDGAPAVAEAMAGRKAPVKFYCPDLSLTGDNAAMIGAAGLMKASRGEFVDPLKLVADPNMRLV
ncbi:MAG: tRNA (adenosine(37)-N6)-threonylcarbamoyltransferase complex transferase subunit TsaD [Candidatus Uhrbacteria bacterium]|nr:tRNA (adenosine(37)-N6)-threonylcarbamoyltransferase complex transferase subunit TsaD [Candidatus Uhrbacteria bacterium]